MRILVVTQYYWPEPLRIADLVAGLRDRGHEIEVLTGLPNYPGGKFQDGYGVSGPYQELHDGIRITRVPLIPRRSGGAVRLILNYASFAIAAGLRALSTGRRRWDAIFVVQLSPVTVIFPALVMRALYGTPVAIWVQDLWPESVKAAGMDRSPLVYRVARAISAALYRRCDRVMGTSRAFQPRLEALGVPPGRFEYLPQWAEPLYGARAAPATPDQVSWTGGFPVMFAGNLGRVQALDTLIGAAELLRDDDDVRWVFVGDGSRREWLEREVARRSLQDKVFLLGRKPAGEMPALYAKAGAMVVSLSRDETMALTVPAKVQSYLAAGKPILGSIDGEAARVIEESGAGWAAPADDAAGLAEIVRRMKALPEAQRESMGSSGRAYSDREFSRERCLDVLERVLRDTAALRRR